MKSLLQAFVVLAVLSFATAPVFAAESTDPGQHVKKAAVVHHHHKKHHKHKKHAMKKAEVASPAPVNAEH